MVSDWLTYFLIVIPSIFSTIGDMIVVGVVIGTALLKPPDLVDFGLFTQDTNRTLN